MGLDNIINDIKNACNYAFNNNGVKVNPNLIRLCDGSPVNSVGTTRLRSKWPYALAIAAPIAVNYMLDEEATRSDFILPAISVCAIAFHRRADIYGFKINGIDIDNLCINKNPDSNTAKTPIKYMDHAETMRSGNILPFVLASSVSPFVPYYSMPLMADRGRVIYTCHKVCKGDWVIEDAPKPEEKEHESIPVPSPDVV